MSKNSKVVTDTPLQKEQKKGVQGTPPKEDAAITAKRIRQADFLKEFCTNRFNISTACFKIGISRMTFYDWRDNDPHFRSQYEDALEARLDKWEECLHKNVLSGSDTAVIFALKTKGKKRGYVEKETQDQQVIDILAEVVAGGLTVLEAAYKINMLGYPLPEVIKIQLSKDKGEEEDEKETPPTSPEDMDRIYREALEARDKQLGEFLPERQAEVLEIKDELKSAESFAPSPGTEGTF